MADLTIGTELETGSAATLLPSKFNRHTFWCGQSGSGKTYALGVVLEQLLLHTTLPIVVLDPNSDFVHLGTPLPQTDSAIGERNVQVLRSGPEGNLKVRLLEMPLRSRAAILQIDPVLDAEEFNAMLHIEREVDVVRDRRDLVGWLRESSDPVWHRIATRLENLGVDHWDLWAWGSTDANDTIDSQPDATVVDLGAFNSSAEQRSAALAILDHLWARREDRIGRLIVIDEAHNLVPPDPVTQVEKLPTERIVQIAAEGRKYGLWLLLSTQRPSKVHPNALSQCDNLALMKMASPRDLTELAQVFGYAPDELLQRSPIFGQGQALFAGGFIERPTLVQMGSRLTREGGVDVPIGLR